jgi:hypothetical protein
MQTEGEGIIKWTEELLAKNGLKGLAAGFDIELAERRVVIKPELEGLIEIATGFGVVRRLGILEKDLRLRLGTSWVIDLNGIRKLPIISGLRQAREVMYARTQEQLKVVCDIATGAYGKEAQAQLEILHSDQASSAQKRDALRKLKAIGMNQKILGEFIADVRDFTILTRPEGAQTPEMQSGWDTIKKVAEELHARITTITSPRTETEEGEEVATAPDTADVIGNYAVNQLQEELNALNYTDTNARELFDDAKWVAWVVENTPGRFGKMLIRTVGALRRLSPKRLTGVEFDDQGKVKLSGLADKVGNGITALRTIALSPNPLEVALEYAEQTESLHADLAVFIVRTGNGETGERLRALFRGVLFGQKGATSFANFLSQSHAASSVGWILAGGATAVAAPHLLSALGEISQALSNQFSGWAETLGTRAQGCRDNIELYRQMIMGKAPITGPEGTESIVSSLNARVQSFGERELAKLLTNEGRWASLGEAGQALTRGLMNFHSTVADLSSRAAQVASEGMKTPVRGLVSSVAWGAAIAVAESVVSKIKTSHVRR